MKVANSAVVILIVIAILGSVGCHGPDRGHDRDHLVEHRDDHRCDREHDPHCDDRLR
jgi:hypothetical protein